MLIITEPVGASILAFLLLHQKPTVYEIAGGALIIAGVYLSASQSLASVSPPIYRGKSR